MPKDDLLTIEDTPTGCRLIGEVDATNADGLKAYLVERIEPDSDFIVECSSLRFMDSSGVHAVLEVARTHGRRGAGLPGVCPQPPPALRDHRGGGPGPSGHRVVGPQALSRS
jgi:anti-anti-sigma factor